MTSHPNTTSDLALKLARSHLASIDAQREFAELVNPRYVFTVMSIAHRLYVDTKSNTPFNRNSLVLDLVPWNLSQATAYRLVEDFVKLGFIRETLDGRIEATEKFFQIYEGSVVKAMIMHHTYSNEPEAGFNRSPDIWFLRDNQRRFSCGGGALFEILGRHAEELVGTLPGDLTHLETMEALLGTSVNTYLSDFYDALWSSKAVPPPPYPWALRHTDGHPVLVSLTVRATTIAGESSAFTFCNLMEEADWRAKANEFRQRLETGNTGPAPSAPEHD